MTPGPPHPSLPVEDDLPAGHRSCSFAVASCASVSFCHRPRGPGQEGPQWRRWGHLPPPVFSPPGTPASLTPCRLSWLHFFHSDFSSAVIPTVELARPCGGPARVEGIPDAPDTKGGLWGYPAASSSHTACGCEKREAQGASLRWSQSRTLFVEDPGRPSGRRPKASSSLPQTPPRSLLPRRPLSLCFSPSCVL